MALAVGTLDRSLQVADLTACLVLACAGLISYAALCWLLDISRIRGRLKNGLALFRTKLANINIGQNQ
jgi:hypothetical protein